MSGFEVTGVVLAILPLIVNQLDNYVQGLETLKSFRTRKYRRDLQRYLDRIKTQRALLLNTLERTLADAIDDENEIIQLINDPTGSSWKDAYIQRSLRMRLGRDYDVFIANMTELSSLLNTLCQKLNINPGSPVEVSWQELSVAKREAKKLKTILSHSIYHDMLARIETTNTLLQTIAGQAHYREESRAKRRGPEKPLLRYRVLRASASSLYNAFIRGKCWKCICRDTHHVRFRLDTTSIGDASHDTQSGVPRFKLVIGTSTMDVEGQSSWAWAEIEAECLGINTAIRDTQRITGSHHTQNNPPPALDQKAKQKQVEFAVVAAGIDGAHCAPPVPTARGPVILDLCATLLAPRGASKDAGAIGVIADEADPSYEHRIYVTQSAFSSQPFKPLRSLLQPLDPLQRLSNNRVFLTRRDRLYLAANLACNVLQLHGSWLSDYWKTDDIYITQRSADGGKPLLDSLFLSLPLAEVFSSHPRCTPRYNDQSGLIQSWILFPLGLVLVELALCQSLDDLRIAADSDPVDTVAKLKTASRNLPLVRSESGMAYARVVKKCLFWSETEDAEIDSMEFQDAMCHFIIKPLVDDLRTFDGC